MSSDEQLVQDEVGLVEVEDNVQLTHIAKVSVSGDGQSVDGEGWRGWTRKHDLTRSIIARGCVRCGKDSAIWDSLENTDQTTHKTIRTHTKSHK